MLCPVGVHTYSMYRHISTLQIISSYNPKIWSTVPPIEASICGIVFIRGPMYWEMGSGVYLYIIHNFVTSSFHYCLTTGGDSDFQCTCCFPAVITYTITFVSYTVNSRHLFWSPRIATRRSKQTVYEVSLINLSWTFCQNSWMFLQTHNMRIKSSLVVNLL